MDSFIAVLLGYSCERAEVYPLKALLSKAVEVLRLVAGQLE
jgi:hypothetical protein